jgi:hypothetical protein
MVFFGNQQIWLRLNPTLQLYYNAIPMLIFRDFTDGPPPEEEVESLIKKND